MLNELDDWELWPFCAEKPRPDQVIPLAGGLTNQCYLLQLEGGAYVLRIEGQNSRALDINRNAEFRIHRLLAAKGLTPAIRYRSPERHYWVRDYVSGRTLHGHDLTLPRLLTMAQQLRRVHRLPVPASVPVIRITDKASHYWNCIAALTQNQPLLDLRAELQSLMQGAPDEQQCLCHMDPTPANWIETPDERLILLDWEYAAIGHPLWDLAALLQQADVSAEEEARILEVYGHEAGPQWAFACAQMNYLAALWYRAQGLWEDGELLAYLRTLTAQVA